MYIICTYISNESGIIVIGGGCDLTTSKQSSHNTQRATIVYTQQWEHSIHYHREVGQTVFTGTKIQCMQGGVVSEEKLGIHRLEV